ncbi:uncharacterized protein BXIN_2570 [Babesia sp. Xinjiang]|uniref:uncharacterized protein n=1 Tax=Babesia sp. Xinjiang TaxID=462227 RepID=UPI000A220034|nr:uncharacterized protein BXIN_2570 [Babesia sp. Xinjiang]ORM41416.1 hypothetical protein BXIN_2570 [Babesia sp. Xinjiang]
MDELTRFAEQVAATVREEWQSIPDPTSVEWQTAFDRTVDDYLAGQQASCNYEFKTTETTPPLPKAGDSAISSEDGMELANRIYAMMEGLWLAGRRKIDALDQCGQNSLLNINDVVSYAMRLRSTTYSPPENSNVHDPTQHLETFPHYHFLGVPNVSQMHSSRLFDLNRLEQLTSAPRVIFEPVSEEMHRMRLECSTPHAVVYYQTSRVNANQIDPHTGKPTVYTTAPAIYDPVKNLSFKTACNPFMVFTWSTCEGLRPSEVVRVEYRPPSGSSDADAASSKQTFGLFLGREHKS